jgi:hypothetical protein
MTREPEDEDTTAAEPLVIDSAESDYLEFSQTDADGIHFRDDDDG